MLSYTGSRNLYKDLTGNDNTSNLTFGDTLINELTRNYCTNNGGKWWFLEKVTTQSTVANQQSYIFPSSTRKIVDLYITVGNTTYSPTAVEDPQLWKRIIQSNLGVGDRALFYYRQDNRVLIAPTPGSNGNTITIRTRKNVVDLRDADYTTGTVTATLNSKTIVGVGTTFTAAMVGRYINLGSGDGNWYEIATFTDTTHVELLSAYEGVTAAGSTYTIAQVSPLPESYQAMPVYKAAAMYWAKEDSGISNMLSAQAEALYGEMIQEAGEKSEGAYMMPVDSMVFRDPNIPEPDTSVSSFT
jgi:hypothetical protein